MDRRLDLIRQKNNHVNRLKTAKRNNSVRNIETLNESINTFKIEIAIIDDTLTTKKDNIDSTRKEISDSEDILNQLDSQVKLLQWDRRNEDISIHTKVKRILSRHGVVIQAYHGGSLTSGLILVLFKKHNQIMEDIRTICHQ